ncbi:Tn3 family transposase [Bacillus mycoides]|uniref:Transposase n=1 Tax=Bacillus mycoides TaxID=1405 RepID=A0A1S9T4T0_BACMY|nr:Tn3 family transposase [Bacillus mycoides]OOR04641.1 transposase [Bacillus mycoides]
MPSIQDTIYPRIKHNLSTEDLRSVYTPTRSEIEWTSLKTKGTLQQLALLILLKTVQNLGFFTRISDIPPIIIKHIAQSAQLPIPIETEWEAYSKTRTIKRHYHFVRRYLKIQQFDHNARQIMLDTMKHIAGSKDDPADLINAAIEELIHQRYELPVYNTFKEAANEIRHKSYRFIYEQVYESLQEQHLQQIDCLFETGPDTFYSPWNRLKEDAKRASLFHLKELILHYDWLIHQKIPVYLLESFSSTKIKQMAAEAKTLDSYRMSEIEKKKRYTLAISLVSVQTSRILDNIGEMLIKRMMSIHKKGREFLQDYKKQTQKRTDSLVATLQHVLMAYQTEGIPEERLQAIQQVLGDTEDQVLQDCEDHLALSGDNYYLFLQKFFKSHRSTLFKILEVFPLRSTNQDSSIVEAIQFLLSHQHTRKEWISVAHIKKIGLWKREVTPLLNLSWIPDGWWRWLSPKKKREVVPEELNRRHFEVCVFSQIMWGLKSGDLYIEGSEKYADYRKQLMSWEEYEENLEEFCNQLNLPSLGSDFTKKIHDDLQQVCHNTNKPFPHNQQIRIEKGEVVIGKLKKKKVPPELKELENYIMYNLEPINVLDMLADTEYWLNWSRFFGPISGYGGKLENHVERYVTNTFCYGCNLGPTQTARSIQEIDRKQIAWINQRHVTVEDLDKAIRYIINAYNRFELPKYWGDGKSASADGTIWDVYEQNLLSENHIRYGGYGGIGYYHVSDTYIALFSNFIPCGVWEGIHILDILMNEKVDIQPEILHSDTQGQSTTVFGLATLLGIQLMPRIRNWKHLKLFRPNTQDNYEHIDELFSGEINWSIIENHYPDMLRIAMSIKAGKITPSTILNTLGTYSKKNKLYQAFCELGRAIRTMFLLQFMSNEELRRTIQSATNKSEAFNGFTKWLFFGGEGIISENDREKQKKIIKYNHLVANCLIFYNVFSMSKLLHGYEKQKEGFNKELICYLSPYMTAHVNRFGKYHIDSNREPGKLPSDLSLFSKDMVFT